MGGQTKHPRLRDWLLVDLLWFVKGQQIMVSLSRVVMFCSQQLIALLLSRLSDTGVFYRQRVQAGLRQSRDPRPKTWQDVHIHHNVLHIVSQTLPDPAVYLGLLDHSIEILVTHHDLARRGLSFIARPALWIHVHHVVSTTYLVRIVLGICWKYISPSIEAVVIEDSNQGRLLYTMPRFIKFKPHSVPKLMETQQRSMWSQV